MDNGIYSVVYTNSAPNAPHRLAHYAIELILLASLFYSIRLLLKFVAGGGRNA